jgi:hypothetical protein
MKHKLHILRIRVLTFIQSVINITSTTFGGILDNNLTFQAGDCLIPIRSPTSPLVNHHSSATSDDSPAVLDHRDKLTTAVLPRGSGRTAR